MDTIFYIIFIIILYSFYSFSFLYFKYPNLFTILIQIIKNHTLTIYPTKTYPLYFFVFCLLTFVNIFLLILCLISFSSSFYGASSCLFVNYPTHSLYCPSSPNDGLFLLCYLSSSLGLTSLASLSGLSLEGVG